MDAKSLLELIARGENEKVDFKRELNLESSDEKAELIKDLVSLANSVNDHGYLIVGVDDNKRSIGITTLEEERIQQIAHTYVYPSIILRCYIVPIDSLLLGVLEVTPTEKPHQVIRSIGRITLNDIFVRHGSTISKASASEINRMREKETGVSREVNQLSDAALKHLKLGNIEQAILSYTKAINLTPTPELLLARGQTYRKYFSPDTMTDYLEVEKGELCLKDLSSALVLADTFELQKIIRLARLELFSVCPLEDRSWEEDYSWAIDNLEDKEYAFVMFYAARKMDVFGIYASEDWDSNQIIEFTDSAIALGFEDPRAYYLRSSAHFANNNNGLALYDINLAVSLISDNPKLLVDFLNLRVGILTDMGKYAEAYDDLMKISEILPLNVNDWLLADRHHLTDEILQRICLQWKFGYIKKDIGIYDFIMRLLILDDGAPKFFKLEDGSLQEYARGMQIPKEFPYLVTVLQEIVGMNVWEAAKRSESYNASISLKPNNTVSNWQVDRGS